MLIGAAFGKTSPVATFAPALYLDVQLKTGGTFEMPPLAPELAMYSVDSDFEIDGQAVAAHTLVLLEPGATVLVSAGQATRFMVLGGEPLDGHRLMWWNFVSSRKERIVQASDDWAAQTMGQVAGETEFIPLPERRFVAG